jgi:hypothetical protein
MCANLFHPSLAFKTHGKIKVAEKKWRVTNLPGRRCKPNLQLAKGELPLLVIQF